MRKFLFFSNLGKKISRENNCPIKLIEPSIGKSIKLQITVVDEMLAKAYKEHLILYAKRMGATYKVMDRTVKIKFSKLSVADNIRYHLKKMLQ